MGVVGINRLKYSTPPPKFPPSPPVLTFLTAAWTWFNSTQNSAANTQTPNCRILPIAISILLIAQCGNVQWRCCGCLRQNKLKLQRAKACYSPGWYHYQTFTVAEYDIPVEYFPLSFCSAKIVYVRCVRASQYYIIMIMLLLLLMMMIIIILLVSRTSSCKICLWCFCMYVLFHVCVWADILVLAS